MKEAELTVLRELFGKAESGSVLKRSFSTSANMRRSFAREAADIAVFQLPAEQAAFIAEVARWQIDDVVSTLDEEPPPSAADLNGAMPFMRISMAVSGRLKMKLANRSTRE